MAEINAKLVKELREVSGAGMMDCKKALVECQGDIQKAMEYLREKGIAKAAKKTSREASEGLIEAYIHMNGKIGVLLELNCETDFVARNENFKELAYNIAMHIAASNPLFISPEDVPGDEVDKEKEILRKQYLNEGKPENVVDKIVEGRIKKYYSEICLLEQEYVKDSDKTVKDIITDAVSQIGENIQVSRFVRFQIGEK